MPAHACPPSLKTSFMACKVVNVLGFRHPWASATAQIGIPSSLKEPAAKLRQSCQSKTSSSDTASRFMSRPQAICPVLLRWLHWLRIWIWRSAQHDRARDHPRCHCLRPLRLVCGTDAFLSQPIEKQASSFSSCLILWHETFCQIDVVRF